MREIFKLILVLTLICGVSASALQFARAHLEDRIEQQNDKYIRGPALTRLFKMPAEQILNNKINPLIGGIEYPVFYTVENQHLTSLAVEASGKGGYGGDIRMMIGIDLRTREILGLEIIQHSETPGVGSQIEKESFRTQWKGLSWAKPIELQQNGGAIQGITGATYSSKALINGSNTIIELVQQHLDDINKMVEANN